MKKLPLFLLVFLVPMLAFAEGKLIKLSTGAEMTVYLPEADKAIGRAVVDCPGGGYSHLSMDNEGHNWAGFYNDLGIAYGVLKYRMPNGDRNIPLSDASEAIPRWGHTVPSASAHVPQTLVLRTLVPPSLPSSNWQPSSSMLFSYFHPIIISFFIQVEHPVHHLPFLAGGAAWPALLEHGHIGLPLCLTGQRVQLRHRHVPVEVGRCLYNHKQTGAQDIDFHLEDAHLTDARPDLWPKVITVVGLPVLGNQRRIVFQI